MSLDQPGIEFFESIVRQGQNDEETATPVFIGLTQNGQAGRLYFFDTFAGFANELGGPSAGSGSGEAAPVLYHAVRHYFDNGGNGCFVHSMDNYPALEGLTGAAFVAMLEDDRIRQNLGGESRIALVCVPDLVLLDVLQSADSADAWSRAWRAILVLCESRRGLFGLLDTPADADIALQCAKRFEMAISTERRAWVAAYWPHLVTDYERVDSATERAVSLPAGPPALAVADSGQGTGGRGVSDQQSATIPAVSARAGDSRGKLVEIQAGELAWEIVPASAAVAAKIGDGDRQYGIWTAPANVSLLHVVKPASPWSEADELFSEDGISINLIRSFPGRGVRIWGCRTLADGSRMNDCYLQVRRLVAYIEASLAEIARFVVFEPNNEITWAKLKGLAVTWLRALWMKGALAGVNEQDAFRVRVGIDESMTAEDVAAGKLIMTVDVATLLPAEFIQITLQYRTGEADTRYRGTPTTGRAVS